MEMVTLTRTQTYAILAYYEIWGPPTKFRTEEIETEFPRVCNRYKDRAFTVTGQA